MYNFRSVRTAKEHYRKYSGGGKTKVHAISDLHLSFSSGKPMDVFGEHWKNHTFLLEKHWKELVGEDDLVLLPGDLSWAMTLDEVAEDIAWLDSLPGRKIITRGNHDYWWSSISRLKEKLPTGIIPLQHTVFDCDTAVVTGTRGWVTPESDEYVMKRDEKIYRRELGRLAIALEAAAKIRTLGKPLIAMLHYPPVVRGIATGFSRMLSSAGVDICVYGHIHNSPEDWPGGLDMETGGVKYLLVSADYLGFRPEELRIS